MAIIRWVMVLLLLLQTGAYAEMKDSKSTTDGSLGTTSGTGRSSGSMWGSSDVGSGTQIETQGKPAHNAGADSTTDTNVEAGSGASTAGTSGGANGSL